MTFVLIDLLPGDPAGRAGRRVGDAGAGRERARASSGSTIRSRSRYFDWLGDVVTGDLGRSFRTGQPVSEALAQRIPVSFELMALAHVFSLVIAIPLGIYTAYRPGRASTRSARTIGFGLIAMPPFVLALLLILLFAIKLGWFRRRAMSGSPTTRSGT